MGEMVAGRNGRGGSPRGGKHLGVVLGAELLGAQVTVSPGRCLGCTGVGFGAPMPEPGEAMKEVFLGYPLTRAIP